MNPEDLADTNLVASYRAHARWQSPCDVLDADGLLCVGGANRFPGPYKNCVVRTDVEVAPADVLHRAQAFFDPLKRKFSVNLRTSRDADLEAHLIAEGFQQIAESPCMVVDRPVAVKALPAGVRVRPFDSMDSVAAAVDISLRAFETLGLPPAEGRDMLARAEAWLGPDVVGFVASADGVPVATALALLGETPRGERHAGVYWVAVVPEARGRGLAELCTALATRAGFDHGAPVVTLQASPMGLPVYERMGYRTVDSLRRYRRP